MYGKPMQLSVEELSYIK